MRTIVTQDNFVASKGPALDPELNAESMTEIDGYRDTERMVKEFIRAGERLAEFREAEFDREEDNDELNIPIERMQDFNMAQASMIMESEAERISKIRPPAPEPQNPPAADPAAGK